MKHLLQIGCTRKLDEDLMVAATAKGVQIQALELLDISYSVRAETARALNENTYPLVITSAHALHAIELLQNKFQVSISGILAFCISGRTSTIAAEMGLNILADAGDSLSLATCITNNFHYKKLLHLGSNLDMKKWKIRLLEKGILVNTLEVYHKTAAPKNFNAPQGMMFFSPSQVEIFFQTNELSEQVPAFCIGKTTAAALVSHKHKNIILPNQPAAELLLQQVYQYFKIL